MINSRVIVIVIFLLSLSLGSFTSCKEPSTGPETRTDSLVLKFKDSDLTSATLSLHSVGVTLPATLFLTRNQDTVQSFSLHQADTTLKDSLLTPSTTYIWQAVLTKSTLKSKPVTGRTMDTTSANFTWQTWEFGDHSSSVLYDVAIINENDIWAVGELNLNDSVYTDVGQVGAIHWDGTKWTPVVIKGQDGSYFGGLKIKSIEYINKKVYMAGNGHLFKYTPDSVYQLAYFPKPYPEVFTHQISDMWGDSDDNIWMVGANGGIFHYTGSGNWEDLSLPSDLAFGKISQKVNGKIYAAGGDYWQNDEVILYELLPRPGRRLTLPPDTGPLSVDLSPAGNLWMGTIQGVFFSNSKKDEPEWKQLNKTLTLDVKVNSENDVYGAGWYELWHYNGLRPSTIWSTSDWVLFDQVEVNENILVAVGYRRTDRSRAFILMGTKQK